ncbi:MAG: RHS repeat-associated core domain-containing protein [Planctomycetota bacterium]
MSDDTFVRRLDPQEDYSAGTTLVVKEAANESYVDRRAYIEFDLSGLSVGSTDVTDATLELWVESTSLVLGDSPLSLSVTAWRDDIDEASIEFDDTLVSPLQSSGGDTLTLPGIASDDAGTSVQLTVTDWVTTALDQGLDRLTLKIKDLGNRDETVRFYSKEHTNPGERPSINVAARWYADTFVVNSLADLSDADPGDGVADAGSYDYSLQTTLRSAIEEIDEIARRLTVAQLAAWQPTISFAEGIRGGQRIELGGTEIDISTPVPVTIVGPGRDELVIDAGGSSRAIYVASNANVTISGLTITGGSTGTESGAGIRNDGTLELQQVRLTGNKASDAEGGGVYNSPTATLLRIVDSTVDSNESRSGGGVYTSAQPGQIVEILRSTVSHNQTTSASGPGGGIAIAGQSGIASQNTGVITITESTISNNRSDVTGGVLVNRAVDVTIEGTTIADNVGAPAGTTPPNTSSAGGISVINGSEVALTGSLLTRNMNNGAEFNLREVAAGLVSTGAPNYFNGDVDTVVGEAPWLSALGDHGGQTETHAILLPVPELVDTRVGVTANDQRDVGRVGGGADFGSFEYVGSGPTIVKGDFDGDGWDDEFLYDSSSGRFFVDSGRSDSDGPSEWASGQASDLSTFRAGDFNGDGRDDVAFRTGGPGTPWSFATSESNRFVVYETDVATNWLDIQVLVGDFDGDAADELIGRASDIGDWQIIDQGEDSQYRRLTASDGTFPLGVAGFAGNIFVGDANGDGFDDLIGSLNPGVGSWAVALSTGLISDPAEALFGASAGWDRWFDDYYNNGVLEADGPTKKLSEVASLVRNSIEVERSQGFMKGPYATKSTGSGNPWDQAALLKEELGEAGFSDISIRSGKVQTDWDSAAAWIGVPAAFLDSDAAARRTDIQRLFEVFGSVVNTTESIQFDHAWVTIDVPWSTTDLAISPSWKFKERQPGVLPSAPNEAVTSFEYLHIPNPGDLSTATAGNAIEYLASPVDETPLAYYEARLQDDLVQTNPGLSLADVPYDGPIIPSQIDLHSELLGDKLTVITSNGADSYNATNSHRVKIAVTGETSGRLLLETTITVPAYVDAAYAELHAANTWITPLTLSTDSERPELNGPLGTITGSADATIGERLEVSMESLPPVLTTGGVESKLILTQDYAATLSIDVGQYGREYLSSVQARLLDLSTSTDATDIASREEWADTASHLIVATYSHGSQHAIDRVGDLTNTGVVGVYANTGMARINPSTVTADSTSPYGFTSNAADLSVPVSGGIQVRPWSRESQAASDEFNTTASRLVSFALSSLEHEAIEETLGRAGVSSVELLRRSIRSTRENDWVDIFLKNDANLMGSAYYRLFEVSMEDPSDIDTLDVTYVPGPVGGRWAVDGGLTLSQHLPIAGLVEVGKQTLSPTSAKQSVVVAVNKQIQYDEWEGFGLIAEKRVDGGSATLEISALIKEGDGGVILAGGAVGGAVLTEVDLPSDAALTDAAYAGDPVQTGNGNMFRVETDIVFPNKGVPLDFTRRYDAQNTANVGLGAGWSHSFADRLVNPDTSSDPLTVVDSELEWVSSTGITHTFTANGDGTFDSPPELLGELVYLAPAEGSGDPGRFEYRARGGMVTRFERTTTGAHYARLMEKVDHNEHGFVVTYVSGDSTMARIDRVYDKTDYDQQTPTNSTRFLQFDQSSVTRIDKVRKYAGSNTAEAGEWRMSFNSTTGLLESVGAYEDASATTTLSLTSYSHYALTAGVGSANKIKTIAEPNGDFHTYRYYANGRVYSVEQSLVEEDSTTKTTTQYFSYNLVRGTTEFVNDRGFTTEYQHNDLGQLVRQSNPDGSFTTIDWGVETTSTGDSDGLLDGTEYLMTEMVDEVGAVETFTYFDSSDGDKDRELKQSTGKRYLNSSGTVVGLDGLVTDYDYLVPANKPHIRRLSSVTEDPAGDPRTTSMTYDPDGRLLSVIDPENQITRYAYYGTSTEAGLVRDVIPPNGHDQHGTGARIDFIDLGRVTIANGALQVTLDDAIVGGATAPIVIDAVRIDRWYDASSIADVVHDTRISDDVTLSNGVTGQPVSSSDTDTFKGLIGNDALLIDAADVAGANATWTFTDLPSGEYRISFVIASAQSAQVPQSMMFSVLDGTTPIALGATNGVVDFFSHGERFTYDAAGNVVNTQMEALPLRTPDVFWHTGSPTYAYDGADRLTTSTYDAIGRLLSTTQIGGSGNEDLLTQYTYTRSGQVETITDANGNTTEFGYDKRGNLALTTYADGAEVRSKYDGNSNLVSATDELDRKTEFVYDSRDRLIQVTYPDGAIERTLYDATGRVVESLDANGNRTTFTYDATGRLTKTVGAAGTVGDEATIQSKYNIFGDLIESLDANGHLTQVRHDKLGRVTKSMVIDVTQVGSFTLENYDYTTITGGSLPEYVETIRYDGNGNVGEAIVYDTYSGGATLSESMLKDPDLRSLLPDGDGDGVADSNGTAYLVGQQRFDSFNRPVETWHADGSTSTIRYDPAGRVRYVENELGAQTENLYDEYGRLETVHFSDPVTKLAGGSESPRLDYAYDAVGNQAAVTDALGSTTEFVYDTRNRLIESTDAVGAVEKTLYDRAGQIVATIDALGVAFATRYDPRGRVSRNTWSSPRGASPILPDGPGDVPTERFRYDDAGNLIEYVDQRGFTTTYEYDDRNRLIAESAPHILLADWTGTGDAQERQVQLDGTSAVVNGLADAVNGDQTEVTGNRAQASLFRFNVPKGDYRVLLRWSPSDSYTASGTAEVRAGKRDGPTELLTLEAVPIKLNRAPEGVVRVVDGEPLIWQEVYSGGADAESLDVEADDGRIAVTVFGPVGTESTIAIDAILIERIDAKTTYAYDSNGNLTATTDTRGAVQQTTYDALNRVLRDTSVDPNGDGSLPDLTTAYTYDGYGNVRERSYEYGATVDRLDTFEYDARNRLKKQVLASGPTDARLDTEFFYDESGNLTHQREASNDASVAVWTRYDYDFLNRLTAEHPGLENQTDLSARSMSYAYDRASNLVGETAVVRPSGSAPPVSSHTEYRYDPTYRLVETIEDFGGVSATSRSYYDAVDNVVLEIDPTGVATSYEYDDLYRLTSVTLADSTPHDGVAERVETYRYDTAGNLVEYQDAESGSIRYAYNAYGQLLKELELLNGDATPNAVRGETRYRYDSEGNRTAVLDGNLNKTVFGYDQLGRVVSEKQARPGQLTDAPDKTRTFTYGDDGNLDRYTDREGRVTVYQYDALDRLSAETWYAPTNLVDDVGKLEWKYDTLGRVESSRTRVKSDGVISVGVPYGIDYTDSYDYDRLDRVTAARNYEKGIGPSSRGYNVLQAYAYDQTAALASGAFAAATRTLTTNNEGSGAYADLAYATVTSTIDKLGRTTSIEAAGSVAGDNDIFIKQKSVAYDYDTAGRMTRAARYEGPADGSSAPTSVFDTAYQYDPAGRLASILHTDTSGPLVSHDYAYDKASRITRVDSRTSTPGFNRSRTETHEYDDAGRLVDWDQNLTTGAGSPATDSLNLELDAAGNRDSASDTVGKQNRPSSDATYNYAYDNEGNLTRRTLKADTSQYTTYDWDHRNRLERLTEHVNNAEVSRVRYVYNNDDLRVQEFATTFASVTDEEIQSIEHYVYDGSELVAVLDGVWTNDGSQSSGSDIVTSAATLQRTLLSGPGIDNRVVEEVFRDADSNTTATQGSDSAETGVFWTAADHMGSVRDLLTQSPSGASLHQHYEYGAFGERQEAVDGTGTAITDEAELAIDAAFAGRDWDDEAGLYYNRARWYDAEQGRFLSEDPIGFAGGDPNVYRYASGDPVNFRDPSGLTPAGNPLVALQVRVPETVSRSTPSSETTPPVDNRRQMTLTPPVLKPTVFDEPRGGQGRPAAERRLARLAAFNRLDNALATLQFELAAVGQNALTVGNADAARALMALDEYYAALAQAEQLDDATSYAAAPFGLSKADGLRQIQTITGQKVASAADRARGLDRAATALDVADKAVTVVGVAAGGAGLAKVAAQKGLIEAGKQVTRVGVSIAGASAATVALEVAEDRLGLPDYTSTLVATGVDVVSLALLKVRAPRGRVIARADGVAGDLLPASSLNSRQSAIHAALSESGATATLRKRSVSMADLRAVTRVTGDEYTAFTQGGRRFLIRGHGNEIRVSQGLADDLRAGAYGRWSGHTHPPGFSLNPSTFDRSFLPAGQNRSAIWGDGPTPRIFHRTPADDILFESEQRTQQWRRLFGQ